MPLPSKIMRGKLPNSFWRLKRKHCLPKSNEERQKSEYVKEIKAELNEKKRNKQMESTLFQNDRLLIILCFLILKWTLVLKCSW